MPSDMTYQVTERSNIREEKARLKNQMRCGVPATRRNGERYAILAFAFLPAFS
jgi:hypothetical protein